MDLKQMRYFVALAEEGNFGRAAEKLHITQPPLTRNIQAIEDEFKTELFKRTSKGATLTSTGEIFLDKIHHILSLTTELEEQIALANKGLIGKLDIGIFTSGLFNIIPTLIGAFHQDKPNIKINLHSMSKVEQITALREKRILIGFNRFVPKEPDIAIESIKKERYIIALHQNHPLANKAVIHLNDLANIPMILYPKAPLYGMVEEIIQAFKHENVQLNIEQTVDDVMTAIALVSCEFGICITTESTSNIKLPHVIYKPLDSQKLTSVDLNCLYLKDHHSSILNAFLAFIKNI